MRELTFLEIDAISGGVLGRIASLIVIGNTVWEAGSYFAQDNGGPSAAEWAASVGYVG